MNREVRVGLMFVLAVLILGSALFYMGNFQEMVTYRIKFAKVTGLAKDSPVHFNGVPIGRVTKIILTDEIPEQGFVPIMVTVAVHRSVRNHIRTSTVADIKSVGVLGDKSILLLTPDYNAETLEDGGMIANVAKSLDVDKILEQGNDMVADAAAITANLKEILDRMVNQDGPLQKMINDKEMAQDMKQAMAALLSYLNQEDNAMALLLKDPEFANSLRTRLDTITLNLAEISTRTKNAEGLLPMLLSDEELKTEVRTKMLALLNDSGQYVNDLTQSKGLLHKMTADEAYGERISANIEKITTHLASILEKIDQGDGTAALLLNDPSLFQGIYEVVYGLQHSGISKWYIQRKQRKGARLKDQENQK